MTLLFSFIFSAYAQQTVLAKKWDKRFGGIQDDQLSSFQQTRDGGFILTGSSASGISGDRTQDNRDTTNSSADYWIVKLNASGNKEWDRRFGGNGEEGLSQAEQTIDGGYILGGFSGSDAGYDKTEGSRGGIDYWMVKIDSSGNKQWDRTFGGTNDDYLSSIQQTRDGGYILGGWTNSGIGGDKTEPCWGGYDYWIVKTDSLGNKQWDGRFGGTLNELMSQNSLLQTLDGGYIMGGSSRSDSSGDKTQNNWSFDNNNFWIVKTDSVGNKIWDKRYGGIPEQYVNTEAILESILLTSDGGFILGGYSYSGIGGDKSQPTQGGDDYWIIKIDFLGNKIWDKDYGGNGSDWLYSLASTIDGGYLLGGYSNSDLSGDKTENCLGIGETWMVKIDSVGNKQWDKTALTTGNDIYSGWAYPTTDGCYVMANYTYAGVGGDKTQPSWAISAGDSSDDYWIVKFCDTLITSVGNLTIDLQLNVYPNPFTTDLAITLQRDNLKQANFTLTNVLGPIIYTQHETNLSPTYTKMLDLSYLPNGVYFLEVVVDGERMVREVVKQ